MPDLNQLLTNLDVLREYAVAVGDEKEAQRLSLRISELIKLIK